MMTASQSFKIYELLHKHFKNEKDAKELVSEIELVIENRFATEKDRLATKEDILLLKEDVIRLETRIEQSFKDQLKWLFVLMFGFSSLIITLLKLL